MKTRSNYFITTLFLIISIVCFGFDFELFEASQRNDGSGLYDIWYSITELDTECVEILLAPITESGETLQCESFVTPSDTGIICTDGYYHILWDMNADLPDREFRRNKVKFSIAAVLEGAHPWACKCPEVVIDYDGNVYKTVRIGNQCWLTSNLKTTHYRDGRPITHASDSIDWISADYTETGAYCAYENDTTNIQVYGLLYNWFAVGNPHELAPEGWRVASDDDWYTLVTYLGWFSAACILSDSADLWIDSHLEESPQFGSSRFNAYPGGERYEDSHFGNMGMYARFWTSSTSSATSSWAYYRYIFTGIWELPRAHNDKNKGLSVRCIKN